MWNRLFASAGLIARGQARVEALPALSVRLMVLLAGMAGALLAWSGVVATDLSSAARATLGVTSLCVGLWASEVVALPVTALLAMVLLYVTGAAGQPEQAFSGFASPVLFFLLGSAALGIAAEQAGLSDRLAAWLLARTRGSGNRLLLELLLSMPLQALLVPSAISRNAVLVPVYERVLAALGRPPRLGAAVMLTLGALGPLASSALLSGGTSPVAASQAIGGFSWISWLVYVAPPYYVLLALGGLAVFLFSRPERLVVSSATEYASETMRGRKRLSSAEWRVAAVSTGTSVLWALDRFTHWNPAIPALLALCILVAPGIGVMSWDAFSTRAPWGICAVLAGAVSLAGALTRTGGAAWLAHGLFGRFAIPHNAPAVALAVFAVITIITLGIPNRAAAITLGVPLAGAFAAGGPLSIPAAGLVVLIAVDVETIYPAQTAANLLAYDRGYFTAGQLARFNLITIALAAAVVVCVALPWWSLTGLPGVR
jgi:anion transporter